MSGPRRARVWGCVAVFSETHHCNAPGSGRYRRVPWRILRRLALPEWSLCPSATAPYLGLRELRIQHLPLGVVKDRPKLGLWQPGRMPEHEPTVVGVDREVTLVATSRRGSLSRSLGGMGPPAKGMPRVPVASAEFATSVTQPHFGAYARGLR